MKLREALKAIESEQLISFHMPGHKNGRLIDQIQPLTYKGDITEIPGADYLHDPSGCLLALEKGLSQHYGSQESKLLINGSTVGILAMMMGVLNRGDKVLVNRNAHQSVYHALELGGLEAVYLVPEMDARLGIVKGIDQSKVLNLLETTENLKACILTYPTYEGLCYDIGAMIDLCHQKGLLVLVDEAHGAHLNLRPDGPKSALDLGADIVVQSFHKTLPAMTQTAGLHFGFNHRLTPVQKRRVLWHLKALQSSSPSYVLMASVDAMLEIVLREGKERMALLDQRTKQFYRAVDGLKTIKCEPIIGGDLSKIILCSDNGIQLADLLRNKFKIQVEYATETICLLMTSIATVQEDFDALVLALKSLDSGRLTFTQSFIKKDYNQLYALLGEKQMAVGEAVLMETSLIPIGAASGRISGEYVIPYPPGIPIVLPGEMLTNPLIEWISEFKDQIHVLR